MGVYNTQQLLGGDYSANDFIVQCDGCNAIGPVEENEGAAIRSWNTRYRPRKIKP